MLVKRRSPRPENKVHPTKTALIDTVVAMLATMPVEEITCDAVLAASGISRGSLYYHFTDFGDLIEHALAVRFSSHVDSAIQALDGVLADSTSGTDFRDRLIDATDASITAAQNHRLERAIPFAAAANSERFRTALGAEQQRLTDAHASTLLTASERGWISPSVDVRAAAVFLQAASLGLVIAELAPHSVDPQAWGSLLRMVFDRVFVDR